MPRPIGMSTPHLRGAHLGAPPADPRLGEAPDFWISGYDEVQAYLDTVQAGHVWELGRSAGGRRIRAVAYGEREPVTRTATRSSALASG
ncbi:MAG: hypothetical protein ACRDI2_02315, partial [Chloroflexota bacterium]